jgi:chemotaxis protein histidine kinase CheA
MGATPSAEQLRNDKCSKSYDTLKRYPHNTYWINKTRADCCAAAPGPHCQGFANINDDNLLEDFSNFSNLNDNVIEGMTSSAMKAKAATDLNSINRSRGIANAHARNAISNSYASVVQANLSAQQKRRSEAEANASNRAKKNSEEQEKRAREAKKRAQEEERKAREAKQRAEAEKKEAEREQKEAEKARIRAEQEKQQAIELKKETEKEKNEAVELKETTDKAKRAAIINKNYTEQVAKQTIEQNNKAKASTEFHDYGSGLSAASREKEVNDMETVKKRAETAKQIINGNTPPIDPDEQELLNEIDDLGTYDDSNNEGYANIMEGFSGGSTNAQDVYRAGINFDSAVNYVKKLNNNRFDATNIKTRDVVSNRLGELLLQKKDILSDTMLDYLIEDDGVHFAKTFDKKKHKIFLNKRKIQLKNYQMEINNSYIEIFKVIISALIVSILLIVLNNKEIIGNGIMLLLIAIIIICVIIFIIGKVIFLYKRDPIKFDKTTQPFDRQYLHDISNNRYNEKKNNFGIFGGTCIGDSCCGNGLVYNSSINKCVEQSGFENLNIIENYDSNTNNYSMIEGFIEEQKDEKNKKKEKFTTLNSSQASVDIANNFLKKSTTR